MAFSEAPYYVSTWKGSSFEGIYGAGCLFHSACHTARSYEQAHLTEPYIKLQSLRDPRVADRGTWGVQIDTDRRQWLKGLSLEFVDSGDALPDVGFSINCSILLDRDGRMMSKTFEGKTRCPEVFDENSRLC